MEKFAAALFRSENEGKFLTSLQRPGPHELPWL
jgi:hypothetical protein